MYEYVNRREYMPLRKEFETLIVKVQNMFKNKNNGDFRNKYSFSFRLIGSGRSKLVTRRIGSNTSFDFDYNLELQKYNENLDCNTIRHDICNAFKSVCKKQNEIIKDGMYSIKESKRVITVVLMKANKKYSADFAIIKTINDGHQILIIDHNDGLYKWNQIKEYNCAMQKVKEIKRKKQFKLIRDLYLYLKSNNQDKNKKSFSIYLEAINNVYEGIK